MRIGQSALGASPRGPGRRSGRSPRPPADQGRAARDRRRDPGPRGHCFQCPPSWSTSPSWGSWPAAGDRPSRPDPGPQFAASARDGTRRRPRGRPALKSATVGLMDRTEWIRNAIQAGCGGRMATASTLDGAPRALVVPRVEATPRRHGSGNDRPRVEATPRRHGPGNCTSSAPLPFYRFLPFWRRQTIGPNGASTETACSCTFVLVRACKPLGSCHNSRHGCWLRRIKHAEMSI